MVERPMVLGLEVGTQSLRAAPVDCNGRMVAFGVGGKPGGKTGVGKNREKLELGPLKPASGTSQVAQA
jgi:hypothetical protein